MKISLQQAIAVLRKGEIVTHSTDTCYGFACDVMNEEALKKLYALKKMPPNKPVSILVGSLEEAQKYGEFDKRALTLAQRFWPGALTLIVKRRDALPKFLNPNSESVGIRVPDHKLSLDLVREFGGPITTTSANVSGKPSTHSLDEVDFQFVNEKLQPDHMIDSGEIMKNPPSTVVDCTGGEVIVVRQGKLSF